MPVLVLKAVHRTVFKIYLRNPRGFRDEVEVVVIRTIP